MMDIGDPDRRVLIATSALLCCAAATRPSPPVVEVAPGLFIRRGVDQDATAANRDAIGNAGFAIGRDAVCVTDPGGGLADGTDLRAQIRRRTTRPIRHVIVSHAHPDHLFGASAFLPDRPAFVGHAQLAAEIAARGAYYRDRLVTLIGADATGSAVLPTVAVQDRLSIPLGGRTLTVTAHPPAHSHSDLSIRDDATGILLLGDLLFVDRVPALDGSLLGWIAVLERIGAYGATRAVPGHGPPIVPLRPAVTAMLRYLIALRDGTRTAIARGLSIDAAVATVASQERGRWHLFDDYHGRNITMAYKELEWE